MSTPFDDGRVGIAVTDWSLTVPWVNVPPYATDVFLPGHLDLTKAQYDKARLDGGQRGTKVQIFWDGTHDNGDVTAERIHKVLTDTAHSGGVEVNIEAGDDGTLANRISSFYTRFRQLRPTRALAVNVVPLKGYVMPLQQMAQDIFCHVRVQTFYGGEMRPADPDECERDITERGFPRERYSICYSAKARRLIDGTIFCDLPVFADRGAYVRKLKKGQIFNLNLMKEAGLL